jgi:AcrR family transcriptional regulator
MMAMRLVHAAAELVCEEGVAAATAPRIATLAGASPRQFHDVFSTVESCLWAGCAQGLSRAAARARRQAEGSAASRAHATLDGMLEFVEQEVELAGLSVAVAADAGATLSSRGSLPERDRLSLVALAPALILAHRALTVLAQEHPLQEQRPERAVLASDALSAPQEQRPARAGLASHAQSALQEQRLAERAGLASRAQSARLLRSLGALRLLERADASDRALLTARGRRIAELLASASSRWGGCC